MIKNVELHTMLIISQSILNGFTIKKDLMLGTFENLKGLISCLANYFDRSLTVMCFSMQISLWQTR